MVYCLSILLVGGAGRESWAQSRKIESVYCDGYYKQHLQGVCTDNKGNIYWSWTDRIVKTNSEGKLLAEVQAPSHQGDLCYKDGKIYVAVNLGKFNEPAGKADSWIYVYQETYGGFGMTAFVKTY